MGQERGGGARGTLDLTSLCAMSAPRERRMSGRSLQVGCRVSPSSGTEAGSPSQALLLPGPGSLYFESNGLNQPVPQGASPRMTSTDMHSPRPGQGQTDRQGQSVCYTATQAAPEWDRSGTSCLKGGLDGPGLSVDRVPASTPSGPTYKEQHHVQML